MQTKFLKTMNEQLNKYICYISCKMIRKNKLGYGNIRQLLGVCASMRARKVSTIKPHLSGDSRKG